MNRTQEEAHIVHGTQPRTVICRATGEARLMITPKSKPHCQVCAAELLQVGKRRVFCPEDDLDLSLRPGCAEKVLEQLVARGLALRCSVCETDLFQVGEWRTVSCPEETLEFFFCPGCAGEMLAQPAARGITLRESDDGALGVYQFKQEGA